MFKNLLTITDKIGTVGVFDSEEDFLSGNAPIRTFNVTANPSVGQSTYDALANIMEEVDETNVPVMLTRLAFMSRFTDAELIGIEVARQTAPEVVTRATITVLKESWMAAGEVDIADARTIQGINILVSAGLLSAERAAEILATPVV